MGVRRSRRHAVRFAFTAVPRGCGSLGPRTIAAAAGESGEELEH
jgi:hypothetical protein